MKASHLCGLMFGLPFYRHRLFETNWMWMAPGHPKHRINAHPRSERYVYGGEIKGLPGGGAGLDVRPRVTSEFIDSTGRKRKGVSDIGFPDEQVVRYPNPVSSEWRRYHDGALHYRPGYEKVPFAVPTIIPQGSLATVQGNGAQKNGVGVGHAAGWKLAAEAMGIDWMKREELTQAIPPVYTEHIGEQLMRYLKGGEVHETTNSHR